MNTRGAVLDFGASLKVMEFQFAQPNYCGALDPVAAWFEVAYQGTDTELFHESLSELPFEVGGIREFQLVIQRHRSSRELPVAEWLRIGGDSTNGWDPSLLTIPVTIHEFIRFRRNRVVVAGDRDQLRAMPPVREETYMELAMKEPQTVSEFTLTHRFPGHPGLGLFRFVHMEPIWKAMLFPVDPQTGHEGRLDSPWRELCVPDSVCSLQKMRIVVDQEVS